MRHGSSCACPDCAEFHPDRLSSVAVPSLNSVDPPEPEMNSECGYCSPFGHEPTCPTNKVSVDTPAPVPERTNSAVDRINQLMRVNHEWMQEHTREECVMLIATYMLSEKPLAAPVPEPEPSAACSSYRAGEAVCKDGFPQKVGACALGSEVVTPICCSEEVSARLFPETGSPPARKDELGTCDLRFAGFADQRERKHFDGYAHYEIPGYCENWKPLETDNSDYVKAYEFICVVHRLPFHEAKDRLLEIFAQIRASTPVAPQASPEAPAKEDELEADIELAREAFEENTENGHMCEYWDSGRGQSFLAVFLRQRGWARLGLSGSVYELCALEAEKSGSRKCGEGCDSLGHCYACPYEIARRIRELGLSGRAE